MPSTVSVIQVASAAVTVIVEPLAESCGPAGLALSSRSSGNLRAAATWAHGLCWGGTAAGDG